MAELATLDILQFYTHVTIITFGSPRVGLWSIWLNLHDVIWSKIYHLIGNTEFALWWRDHVNNTLRMVCGRGLGLGLGLGLG